jgi:hypothetical protein
MGEQLRELLITQRRLDKKRRLPRVREEVLIATSGR